MGQYMATSEERKHMQWCMNNGIKISPFAHNTYEWYIDIEIKDLDTSEAVERKTNKFIINALWRNGWG